MLKFVVITDAGLATKPEWFALVLPLSQVTLLKYLFDERKPFHEQLNSLRWFSQRRSRTPHFWRLRTQGRADPQIQTRLIFCTMHLPPSFIILCLLVRKLWCWQTNKQTNIRRWKHPTFFATLRLWLNLLYIVILWPTSSRPTSSDSVIRSVHYTVHC